jgi:hypothetical protein
MRTLAILLALGIIAPAVASPKPEISKPIVLVQSGSCESWCRRTYMENLSAVRDCIRNICRGR